MTQICKLCEKEIKPGQKKLLWQDKDAQKWEDAHWVHARCYLIYLENKTNQKRLSYD